MRSKIISLLLAFMMIFTLIPATAFAETAGTDLIEVTVNVAPSTADVTFYEGEDAVTPLSAEQVTDNGIVEKYHQYVLKVEKGTYSYRGVDTLDTEDPADDQNLGGMAFNVPVNEEIMEDGSTSGEGQTLVIRRVNFYTTNASITTVGDYTLNLYPSNLPQAVNGEQYLGTIGSNATQRVITPVLALARGNALTYQVNVALKLELAETYGVANIANYTLGTGTSAASSTFSLAQLKDYSVTVPATAKVQMFNQINNFNVEEVAKHGEVKNEDGTVTHNYKAIGNNLTYRVTMKDKITRAGFFGSASENIVITYDENENPETIENDMEDSNMKRRIESSTMVNVNGQNNLNLGTGETFRLRAYRGAWQLINTDTANIMIEPDFNYKVISGGKHIEMTPAANKCTGNAGTGDSTNWMDIRGVSEGTAIIEVSYDAIRIGGEGTKYDGLYGATDPQRTSLIVINVGGAENTLKMQAAGSANLWDTEYDTVYFTGESGTLNFTAAMGEDTPEKVELSTDKGESWNDVTSAEGVYTAEGLIGGNNILRFTKGNKVEYQVVRAAKVTYTVKNLSREGEEIIVGDEVKIVFKGLYTPVSKFSGIYNPGYGQGHKVVYDLPEGVTAVASGGQYDFISTNTYTVTTGAAGMLNLAGGHVEFNVMGVDNPLGGHRILTDAGAGTNFSAVSTMHARGVLPDITLEVTEMPYTPVTVTADTEGTEITVTDTDGNVFNAEDGIYTLPYGTYKYEVVKEGYVKESGRFKVTKADYLQGSKSISIKMRKIEGAIWDGTTVTEPAQIDDVYQIGTGAELAWFAQKAGGTSYNAVLTDDISLGGFNWTPIAKSSGWKGTFDGNGHYVTDLYINSTSNYVALFGYVSTGAVIKNLGVKGEVTTTGNTAAGIATAKTTSIQFSIENCKSEVNVTAEKTAGGIIAGQGAKQTVINCYNTGDIKLTGTKTSILAGGVSCASSASQKVVIENAYNTGNISGVGKHGSVVYLSSASYAGNVKNCYGLEGTSGTNSVADTEVTADELKALAPTLGEAYLSNPTSYNNGYPILKWEEARVLPIAKEDAVVELAAYKNAADYREAEAKTLADTITAAETAINDAATLAVIGTAVTEAKAAMDVLKTDAEYTAEELAAAKESAKTEIAAYKNAADYRTAEADTLATIVEEATAAIERAAVITEIQPIVEKAKADMDALKTDAQLTAEELAAAKETAKAEVTAYKNAADYRTAEADTLATILEEATAAIERAAVITEIQPIVEKAKADMDALKTDAQLTAEELAAAKETAKAEVAAYKNAADYRETEAEILASIISAADAAIENAVVITDIQPIVDKVMADMDALKTDAQLTAEELAAAKESAIAEIEDYKNADDYRVLQKIELEAAIHAAKKDINAAETIDQIAPLVADAKVVMDAIKTDAQLTAEEELAAAKESGIKEVRRYKNADAYREAEQAVLAEIIADAQAEIEAAATVAEVEELVEDAKKKLEKVKTDDQLTAEESLSAAERAQLAAEEAKAAAEEALAEAEAAQKAAEDAQAKAEESQKAAEQAKADAAVTKAETEKLAEQAAADKAAAEAAKEAAEKALAEAETAGAALKAEAEAAQKAAEDAQAKAEESQKAAEQAKAEAEAAKAETEKLAEQAAADKAAAEVAKEAAEKALAEAETAGEALKAEAEAAQKAAEDAQAKAEESQKAAEQAKADAEATKAETEKLAEQAAADKAAAESAKEAAEAAEKASGENLAAIEKLKTEAEKLANQAAADREAAESAKEEAEKLAEQAAIDKAAAEQAKADAEKAKADAEAAKKAAEEAESNANATQIEIEKLKAEAEIKAAEAEMAQLAAEEAQAKAELAQAEVEAAKAATEAERAAAEQAKADAETAQKKAEEQIAQAESVKAELEKALAEVQAKLDALNEVKQLAAPTGLKAKNVAKSGKIIVTWKAVKGADEYVVYRAKSKNGAYRKMFTTTGTKYTDTSAKAGTTYYYKVKAVSDSKTVENSTFSKIVKRTCDLKRPEVKAKSTAKKQVKLTWKRVKGADKYVVYRATAKNGTYKKIYTTKKLQLTNIKLKSGKTYYYKVKAIDKDKSAANSAFSIVKKVKCK